jgi:hypothetical protein
MSDLGRICPTLVGRFWKMILFQWLWMTPSLVDNETICVGNIISLSFHEYEDHRNRRWYASCASIWSQSGPGLWVWLVVRICNPELGWISTLACAHLLGCLEPSWCLTCPTWPTPWSCGSDRRRGCERIETCLVVATWRNRQSKDIYRQWGGIGRNK